MTMAPNLLMMSATGSYFEGKQKIDVREATGWWSTDEKAGGSIGKKKKKW